MVTVLHALDEETEHGRDLHISLWHGTIHPRDARDDNEENPIVCWCGGRRYDLSPEVCVVWHKHTVHWHEYDQGDLDDWLGDEDE